LTPGAENTLSLRLRGEKRKWGEHSKEGEKRRNQRIAAISLQLGTNAYLQNWESQRKVRRDELCGKKGVNLVTWHCKKARYQRKFINISITKTPFCSQISLNLNRKVTKNDE